VDVESAPGAADAGEERTPAPATATVAEKGRVLLLEADPCFRETIRCCLVENGYTVVAVRDSHEGLREVMAGDFALVFYDPLIPGLRGDMFYNSVERIDPEVCERFVFMCCDRVDASTKAFIRNINGLVLGKPFDAKDLLASFDLTELRHTFHSVFEGGANGTHLSGVSHGEDHVGGRGAFLAEEAALAGKVAAILARSQGVAPGDGDTPPVATADAGNAPAAHRASVAAMEQGRVLLVEADPSFRASISDFLAGNGYPVVAVRDTGEALREMMRGDFGFILYDPETFGMPPAKFYHGVKRLEPEICDRFLFMLGEFTDAGTGRFIRKIDGFVLRKPFEPQDILGALAAAGSRGTFQGLLARASADPVLSQISLLEYDVPAGEILASQSSGVVKPAAVVSAPGVPGPVSGLPWGVLPDSEPEVPEHAGTPGFLLAGLALVIVLIAGLWKPYWDARDRIAVAETNRVALDAEWNALSQSLQKAVATEPKIEMYQSQLAGISADRGKPRWAPVLRSVVACAGLDIQMREVRTGENSGDEKTWTLLVAGFATGSDPSAVAERYRADLQRDLDRIFPGSVSIRFDRFKESDGLPSTQPGERRGAFTMTATIRFDEKAKTAGKEGA
jgi:DNA-binding response OmpR family regulator